MTGHASSSSYDWSWYTLWVVFVFVVLDAAFFQALPGAAIAAQPRALLELFLGDAAVHSIAGLPHGALALLEALASAYGVGRLVYGLVLGGLWLGVDVEANFETPSFGFLALVIFQGITDALALTEFDAVRKSAHLSESAKTYLSDAELFATLLLSLRVITLIVVAISSFPRVQETVDGGVHNKHSLPSPRLCSRRTGWRTAPLPILLHKSPVSSVNRSRSSFGYSGFGGHVPPPSTHASRPLRSLYSTSYRHDLMGRI